ESAAGAPRQHILELGMHGANSLLGRLPVDAGICDGYPVLQIAEILWNRLVTPAEMTFDHQADDGLVALEDLVGDVLHHQRLQCRILVRIGVAAVDHDVGANAALLEFLLAHRDADRVVVWLAVAAAQYDVAVGIAFGGDDGYGALGVDAEETV